MLEFDTNHIIIGNGEVPTRRTRYGIAWVLPGGRVTQDRAVAEAYARKIDTLITNNLSKYNRKLFK